MGSQCGWMRFCTRFAMRLTITNCWRLFCYGVKIYHYEKLFSIREFLERLAQDFIKNPFLPDIGTPEKNIPPLDEFDDVDTVSTCRAHHLNDRLSR